VTYSLQNYEMLNCSNFKLEQVVNIKQA